MSFDARMINMERTTMKHIFTKPKRMKKERWEMIQLQLMRTCPGYLWYRDNQHLFNDDGISRLTAKQLIPVISRTFKYLQLSMAMRGGWESEVQTEQRLERWVGVISKRAAKIATEANVNEDKVFNLLFTRLFNEIMK